MHSSSLAAILASRTEPLVWLGRYSSSCLRRCKGRRTPRIRSPVCHPRLRCACDTRSSNTSRGSGKRCNALQAPWDSFSHIHSLHCHLLRKSLPRRYRLHKPVVFGTCCSDHWPPWGIQPHSHWKRPCPDQNDSLHISQTCKRLQYKRCKYREAPRDIASHSHSPCSGPCQTNSFHM